MTNGTSQPSKNCCVWAAVWGRALSICRCSSFSETLLFFKLKNILSVSCRYFLMIVASTDCPWPWGRTDINQTLHFLDICSLEVEMGLPGGFAFLKLEITCLNFSKPSKNGVMGGVSIFLNVHKLFKDLFFRNTMLTPSINV